jgi:hypothetical protein
VKDISELPPAPTLGVFNGRVVSVHTNGDGEVAGFCGPHRVVIPASLMNGTRVGDEIRYGVNHLRRLHIAVATHLIQVGSWVGRRTRHHDLRRANPRRE